MIQEGRALILSGDEIRRLFGTPDFVGAVGEVYEALSEGRAELSTKFHWEFSVGRSAAFASVVPEWRMMATKVGSVRPGNAQRGLPTGVFQVVLQDTETGQPLAILDGKSVTTMRTGAAAAVGAKTLARPDSHVVAIIGPGVVGKASLEALASVFALETAFITGIDAAEAEGFVDREGSDFAFPLRSAPAEEAVCESDIVVTVTPSTEPIVRDAWVQDGTHISAIGSDWSGKQELETDLLVRSRLVTDSRVQCLEIGEGNVPHAAGALEEGQIHAEIGEVLTGARTGREDVAEVTVFDSSGLAVQDLAAARLIYETAMEAGYGRWVEI